jgi:hypothetical protein
MLGSPSEYSDNELKLINIFGLQEYSKHVMPPTLYREMAIMCVKDDRKGPEVQAVRRALKAIDGSSPYRLTEEFDKLIELE